METTLAISYAMLMYLAVFMLIMHLKTKHSLCDIYRAFINKVTLIGILLYGILMIIYNLLIHGIGAPFISDNLYYFAIFIYMLITFPFVNLDYKTLNYKKIVVFVGKYKKDDNGKCKNIIHLIVSKK